MKTAILLGATGLVGSHVLQQLLNDNDFSSIIVLTRKTLNRSENKIKEVIVDFNQLENYADEIKGDAVFCCLGTTIKKAGSEEAFKKVDYEYPLKVGEIAKKNGVQQYLLISAIGSSKNSIVFYNRVKGEVEFALAELKFSTLHILQPSLIIGERQEKRTGEGFAQSAAPVIDKMMFGPFSKYRSIKAEQIAKAMIHYSKSDAKGVFKHDSNELQKV